MSLSKRIVLAGILAFAATLAHAQNMAQVIAAASQGVQSGNLSVFGVGSAQRLSAQLGSPAGAQVYQNIAALGPAVNVNIFAQYPMPNGVVVQARTLHPHGYLDWTVGYSYLTQRIEFGKFNGVSNGMPIIPGRPVPPPDGDTSQGRNPKPSTPPVPKDDTEACNAYPTLCN